MDCAPTGSRAARLISSVRCPAVSTPDAATAPHRRHSNAASPVLLLGSNPCSAERVLSLTSPSCTDRMYRVCTCDFVPMHIGVRAFDFLVYVRTEMPDGSSAVAGGASGHAAGASAADDSGAIRLLIRVPSVAKARGRAVFAQCGAAACNFSGSIGMGRS